MIDASSFGPVAAGPSSSTTVVINTRSVSMSMDPKTVEKLEKKLKQAIVEVIEYGPKAFALPSLQPDDEPNGQGRRCSL